VTVYTDAGAVETPEDVIGRLFAAIARALPGWSTGGEGTLEVALTEEFGRESADLRYLALIREPARAFREFGISVAGLPMVAGTASTIPVRLDLTEPGATAPASLLLVGTTADGVEVEFETPPVPITAAAGASSVTTTATATASGDAGNGVPTGPLVLATSTSAVLGAAATGPSVGGNDDETPEDYLDRLVQAQSTLVRSIVLARDAAIQARSVPGVHRAIAVDNYDASTGQSNVERTVSVYAVDDAGNSVTGSVRAALVSYLDGLRETNFVVRVGDPTYTAVSVVFAAKARAGADPATVQAALIAKAFAILDPGSWAGGDDEPPAWRDERVVRFLDLAGQLDAVPGVDYLTSLTLNGGTVDVTLPGVVALPASRTATTPTTVTGTVSS
jgi:hypothetical protein